MSEYHLGRHGTFLHRFSISSWRWAVGLYKFEDHWSLHLFCLWIRLWVARDEPEDMLDRWGICLDTDWPSICFDLGPKRRWRFVLPWAYDHCRTEVMLKDGTFVPYERWRPQKSDLGSRLIFPDEPADIYRETLPYHYMLDNGEVQHREATITAERRTWCWQAWPFRVWRWPSKTRAIIDVKFSDEVGEGTGSWKGGTVGCGFDLRQGEEPAECLRRMQRTRRFD